MPLTNSLISIIILIIVVILIIVLLKFLFGLLFIAPYAYAENYEVLSANNIAYLLPK